MHMGKNFYIFNLLITHVFVIIVQQSFASNVNFPLHIASENGDIEEVTKFLEASVYHHIIGLKIHYMILNQEI